MSRRGQEIIANIFGRTLNENGDAVPLQRGSRKSPVRKSQTKKGKKAAKVRPPKVEPKWVFLTIPYDRAFEHLYLACITALTSLGLYPKTTLGIPGGQRRLDRILHLIASCKYSVHDLSRVQLDRTVPRTPRFNMPF